MIAEKLEALIREAPLGTLDNVSRDVWKALTEGQLSDDQAQGLAEAIHARKVAHRKTPGMASGGSVTASGHQGRSWSYFPVKKPQRSPERAKSLERRRTLAATGPMPPSLACRFTTGELAVLKIVADECATGRTCTLSIPEIAARAGVGQTKARLALRIAQSLGLVSIIERRVHYKPNLTNVVRIVSPEWLSWVARWKPQSRVLEGIIGESSASARTLVAPRADNIGVHLNRRHRSGEGSLLRGPRNQRFMKTQA